MFTEEFLRSLSGDPILDMQRICEQILSEIPTKKYSSRDEQYIELLDATGLFLLLVEVHKLDFHLPNLTSDIGSNINLLMDFYRTIKRKIDVDASTLIIARAKVKYSILTETIFVYEFSDGDLKRIQQLINELRDIISESKEIGDDHKRRLLKKLEKLQSELHKKMSDLDRFWGILGEAGVILYNLGVNAKPMIDRIREIIYIVWRTQSMAEELPSDAPFSLLSFDDKKGNNIKNEK